MSAPTSTRVNPPQTSLVIMSREGCSSIPSATSKSPAEPSQKIPKRLLRYQPLSADDHTVQYLGAFLTYLPPDGRVNLAADIDLIADDEDEGLHRLVQRLDVGLLRPMVAAGGLIPVPNVRLPRWRGGSGFEGDDDGDNAGETLCSEDINPGVARAQLSSRKHCLSRDGPRCVISGDWGCGLNGIDIPPGTNISDVEAAHILPLALGVDAFDRRYQDDDRRRRSTVWTNLYRYFPTLKSGLDFGPESINDERNVMMVTRAIHYEMGRYKIILEEMETEIKQQHQPQHRYTIKALKGCRSTTKDMLPADGVVAFTTQPDTRYARPDPYLIKVHAAIGNILHVTEVGQRLQPWRNEMAHARSLRRDGRGRTRLEEMLSVSKLALLASSEVNVSLASRPRKILHYIFRYGR
ncbi:uncharacterized protein BO97DRAFT_270436 [Aspergillus homomorphus CBS 101889]|uniref:HNH nuclease domain-containing protein n=1 Tax=Aspergillus homomorphus (strain CBS 101889) TaxID=1450537 RepID=A0A395I2P5_ASPHC|nr:hypothetical protein BO97DRAFT_270436 [Aspergillus homomorphus CBS 101889]RAL14451.1 hypothetical protein BO97DRAFT_270436 [Aspergillus homomorphus CBS 101889]